MSIRPLTEAMIDPFVNGNWGSVGKVCNPHPLWDFMNC